MKTNAINFRTLDQLVNPLHWEKWNLPFGFAFVLEIKSRESSVHMFLKSGERHMTISCFLQKRSVAHMYSPDDIGRMSACRHHSEPQPLQAQAMVICLSHRMNKDVQATTQDIQQHCILKEQAVTFSNLVQTTHWKSQTVTTSKKWPIPWLPRC
jgi:hypothetical protein